MPGWLGSKYVRATCVSHWACAITVPSGLLCEGPLQALSLTTNWQQAADSPVFTLEDPVEFISMDSKGNPLSHNILNGRKGDQWIPSTLCHQRLQKPLPPLHTTAAMVTEDPYSLHHSDLSWQICTETIFPGSSLESTPQYHTQPAPLHSHEGEAISLTKIHPKMLKEMTDSPHIHTWTQGWKKHEKQGNMIPSKGHYNFPVANLKEMEIYEPPKDSK